MFGRGRRARTLGTRFWSGCREKKNRPKPAVLRHLPPAKIVFDAVLMLLIFHCEKVKICTGVNKEQAKRFLYIGLYVCSGGDGFTGICADLSLPFASFAGEKSVFEDRAAGMSAGTKGKLRAAAIRAAGIFVGKLNIIVVRLAQTTRPHHMELDPGFLHGRLIIPGTGIAVRPGIGIERRAQHLQVLRN